MKKAFPMSRAHSVALLFLIVTAVVVLARPTLLVAGDAEGINGYRFKIYEEDNYVPPGDSAPGPSAQGEASWVRGPQGTSPSVSENRHVLPSWFCWSWLLQLGRRL